ncbi:hypothetical protein H0H81_004502 [Sphagnurus paluster]|uniref:BTB domain-containing protein n=1 Tax=Sphagnurus paluster TaxID=117069 RepID=A0A9P7K7V5_9AGAR|nr:hypothetical protein H0H81_004502 [Sphagnurus paluster]
MRPESWTTFHCENPDFVVKSVPDDISFKVNRASMRNSEVFRTLSNPRHLPIPELAFSGDMFSVGEADSENQEQVVDLHETTSVLLALLRLLHYPLAPPILQPDDEKLERAILNHKLPKRIYDPATVIPLPILISLLYPLVDKYALSDAITKILNAHLLAHAPVFPMPIYGFATAHKLEYVACQASQYLMPLSSYKEEEIIVIPTVSAYHKLVQLQALRVKALRELVLKEDIFPHGYGACTSHQRETTALWDAKRIALAPLIETSA